MLPKRFGTSRHKKSPHVINFKRCLDEEELRSQSDISAKRFCEWERAQLIACQKKSTTERNEKSAPAAAIFEPPSYHILRSISHVLAWLLISGVLTLPFLGVWGYRKSERIRATVLGASTSALNELNSAKPYFFDFNISQTNYHIERAYQNFAKLQSEVAPFNVVSDILAPWYPKGQSYYQLLETGLNLTKAGTIITQIAPPTVDTLGERMSFYESVLLQAQPFLQEAAAHAREVDFEQFDSQYHNTIQELIMLVGAVNGEIDTIIESLHSAAELLGNNDTQRYLLLFQNPYELRPTGGFVGSLAFVDVYQGEVKKVEVPAGGSYDVGGAASKFIMSPRPLHVLNPLWEIQDCNWFPDFAASAQKCAWFVERNWGMSVDGVISFNATVLPVLLAMTGNILVEDTDTGEELILSPETILPYIQSDVAQKRTAHTPKQIIADIFPTLITNVINRAGQKEFSLDVITRFARLLAEKEIQVYVKENPAEQWIKKQGFAGTVIQGAHVTDYIHVNSATVNGGKSDFSVAERVNISVHEVDSGLKTTVEIVRTHNGVRMSEEAGSTQDEQDFNYLVTQPNLAYIRVYAQKGAQLISVTGDVYDPTYLYRSVPDEAKEDADLKKYEEYAVIDEKSKTRITQEFGKTVFGNYLFINPGESKKIVFTYIVPSSSIVFPSSQYALFVQKQSGIESNIAVVYNGKVLFEGVLDTDMLVSQE